LHCQVLPDGMVKDSGCGTRVLPDGMEACGAKGSGRETRVIRLTGTENSEIFCVKVQQTGVGSGGDCEPRRRAPL